ncbi:MAG: LON peptidase substrate-binding domain-containing protein [Dongiaceae bacterium]
MRGPFDPSFESLPVTLPIFPLAGALLLPRGRLPLNIFEPRYIAMTRDALSSERLIGMIQPTEDETSERPPAVYPTGCAGRIIQFAETDDGRYLITLAGLCRFDVIREVPSLGGYRRVVPDFNRYRVDMESATGGAVDRDRLIKLLKPYLAFNKISVDWKAVATTEDDKLVTSLAMVCPFEPNEKQALLEAATLADRGNVMIALLELAVLVRNGEESARH